MMKKRKVWKEIAEINTGPRLKPLIEIDGGKKRRLLILSCSKAKHHVRGEVASWDLYDGHVFRVIKAAQKKAPWLWENIDRVIVSAEYGLLSPASVISTYDCKMTAKQAMELGPEIREDLREVIMHNTYAEIFIFAGGNYLKALQPFSEWNAENVSITIADPRHKGGGEMSSHLKKWVGLK